MHPIERLRYVARAGDVDPTLLASEAAEALAALAEEPRALVPACRRLLEAHPVDGPLWWLCARVLGSVDPARAAWQAGRLLVADDTVAELAGALPAGSIVAAEASARIVEALAERPDCAVALVGRPNAVRHGLRLLARGTAGGPEALGYLEEEADEALSEATLALFEARAAGPDGAVLDEAAIVLAGAATSRALPAWLVAGVGRVLPPELFAACVERAAPEALLAAASVAVVVGPTGARPAADALGLVDCPTPSELLVRQAMR